jgi:ankyrin repeat protein
MTDLQFHGIRAASAVEALVIAASNSRLREMKLLLADGVDVNGVASFCGGAALYEAARLGAIRSVEYLVGAGADLNLTNNKFDLTPLMAACSLGKTKGSQVALRLIAAGADVNYVRAADEMTALKFSVQCCPAEVIQTLIGRGAEVDGPPGTDQTALMIAARYNNVAALEVLVKNGADVSLPCKLPWAGGRTAEGLAELEKKRAALAYLRGLRVQ